MRRVVLDVVGTPAPQGSKRAFINKATGKPILVESSKYVASWRDDVRAAAREKFDTPLTGPVGLRLTFLFLRPASHMGKTSVRASAPTRKLSRPDLDKLIRSTMDALTGIVFVDDAQVDELYAHKAWVHTRSGAYIEIQEG